MRIVMKKGREQTPPSSPAISVLMKIYKKELVTRGFWRSTLHVRGQETESSILFFLEFSPSLYYYTANIIVRIRRQGASILFAKIIIYVEKISFRENPPCTNK